MARTAIANYCVDPRLEGFVTEFQNFLGVDKVYRFKTPGPDGIWHNRATLLREYEGNLAGINRLDGVVGGTEVFAFVGHHNCAGFDVPDEQHKTATRAAAQALSTLVRRWPGKPREVVAVFQYLDGTTWRFEDIGRYPVPAA